MKKVNLALGFGIVIVVATAVVVTGIIINAIYCLRY